MIGKKRSQWALIMPFLSCNQDSVMRSSENPENVVYPVIIHKTTQDP